MIGLQNWGGVLQFPLALAQQSYSGDVSVLIGEYPEIVELTLESRFDKSDPSSVWIRFKEDKKHYWLLKKLFLSPFLLIS